jgi:hypothetical protein
MTLQRSIPKRGSRGRDSGEGIFCSPRIFPFSGRWGGEIFSIIALEPDEVHEDEAALSLAKALAAKGLRSQDPMRGDADWSSTGRGIVNFDPEAVRRINRDREWSFACTHINSVVGPGSVVAAFRILPLCLKRDSLERAVEEASPFSLIPFIHRRVGLVSTGQEILEAWLKIPSVKNWRGSFGNLGEVSPVMRSAATDRLIL